MIKIKPNPKWEESPSLNIDGFWCGRYVTQYDGGPDVEVQELKPPIKRHQPVKFLGVWYWRLSNRRRGI